MTSEQAIRLTAYIDLAILIVLAIDVYISYLNNQALTKK